MNDRYLKPLLLLFFVVLTFSVQAQRTVTGTVTDSATGETMVGVTVRVCELKGKGTATDASGRYRLQLPEGKSFTLEVSYVGYEPKKKSLSANEKGTVDFVIRQKASLLDMVVVTGTRTPKLLKDAPIVTRVITHEAIEMQDATDIRDVLQTEMPGVEFSYSMGQQVVNIQGFGGNSVLFLVDGERLAGESVFGNLDYSRLNMDNVERVEIVKGAASSLYGSDAVGGVVNIITRNSDDRWNLNLNTRYASHNEQRHGGTLGFKAGGLSSITNVQYNSADAIAFSNDGDFGSLAAHHSWNFKEKLTYDIANRLKITAKAGYFFRERESQPMANERYRDFCGGVTADHNIDSNNSLSAAYNFDQYDKSDYNLTSLLDVRDYSNVQNSVRTLYNHTFSGNNILTLGGDYLHDYLMTYQFADNGAKFQHTADVFAQYDWNPTKKLNIIGGLRYDYYSDAGMHSLSPKLGMMYKFKHSSLRASYAKGFRAPKLKEMYMNFDMASIFMIYGNPDLKPEKSHNFTLAAEYTKNSYNVTVMGFYNNVTDRIATAWDREVQGQVYVNMSPLQIAGIDASASARWSCGLGVRLSYVYTYEHIEKGQPELSSTRPHTATVRVEYGKKWRKYGFNIALNGRILSAVTCDEYTSMTDYTQTEKATYPGYTIWKLTLSQKIAKAITLNTAIDNLFNYVPEYYYSNSPATTGTTFSVGLSVDVERLFR